MDWDAVVVDKVMVNGLTKAEYSLFEQLVGEASGLNLPTGESIPLRAALCERVEETALSGFGEYYELLRSPQGSAELGHLIELLTIHETSFFRNQTHFESLTKKVVPELLARNAASRTLRLWSAGCSTGQEAYSIALSLLESIPSFDQWQVEVLATDISYRALETARDSVYSERAIKNVDPVLLDRYFERCAGGYRVGERARRLVRFEHLNLVKEPYPLAALSPCDVIFCENVTIYFKVESTRRVIRNFFDTLREGGYLFLGYSESLWQISDDFVLREMNGAFLYQKPSGEAVIGAAESKTSSTPTLSKTSPSSRVAPRGYHVHRVAPARRKETLEEAEALYESRRHEEALLATESVLADNPASPGAHLLAAKLRADREEVGPALRHCRRALEADPLLEEGHYLTGILLLRGGDEREAIRSLSKVIYLNPSGHRSALSHFHLAGLHAEGGGRAAAAREYRNALRVLEWFARDELVGEFSADFLARVCRRRLEELERA